MSRPVQSVMAPMYHRSPLRRATAAYSPAEACSAAVWSQTVGTAAMKPVNSGVRR